MLKTSEKQLRDEVRQLSVKNNEKSTKAHSLKQELIIEAQQHFLFNNSDFQDFQKCFLCSKTFMNQSYLVAHINRRHKKEIPGKSITKAELKLILESETRQTVLDRNYSKKTESSNILTEDKGSILLEDMNQNRVKVNESKGMLEAKITGTCSMTQNKHWRSLPNIPDFKTIEYDRKSSPFHRTGLHRKSVRGRMGKRLSSIRKKVYSSLQNIRHKTKEDQRSKYSIVTVVPFQIQESEATFPNKILPAPDLIISNNYSKVKDKIF